MIVIDRVELPQRLSIHLDPGLATVITHIGATVAADQQVVRLLGVDPHRLIVAVRVSALDREPGFAAIIGLDHWHTKHIDLVCIFGRDPDLSKVITIGIDHLVQRPVMRHFPAGTRIIRAPNLQTNNIGLEQIGIGITEFIDDVLDTDLIGFDPFDQLVGIDADIESRNYG